MFLAWWSVALPAAFASTCFTCCLQDGVTPQERKNLLNPAGESYPVGIWQGSWSYSAAFTALIKIGIEEKLGYNAVWQPRGLEGDGIYALAGCTDPKYFDPQTYTSNFSQKGCGPKVTRTQIMVGMSNGTYVAEAMQNIQQHYPHMLPQLYPSNLQRGWSGPAVFPSEIAAGQLVSLNLSLHSAYHADNKLALAQVFSNIADVDVSIVEISSFQKNYCRLTGSDRWQRWRFLFQWYRLPWGILLACAQLPHQQLHVHPCFASQIKLRNGGDDAESGLLEHTLGYSGCGGLFRGLLQHCAGIQGHFPLVFSWRQVLSRKCGRWPKTYSLSNARPFQLFT